MKNSGNGQLMLESRNEVETLWNVLEIAYASGKLNSEEMEVTKRACGILEVMDYTW